MFFPPIFDTVLSYFWSPKPKPSHPKVVYQKSATAQVDKIVHKAAEVVKQDNPVSNEPIQESINLNRLNIVALGNTRLNLEHYFNPTHRHPPSIITLDIDSTNAKNLCNVVKRIKNGSHVTYLIFSSANDQLTSEQEDALKALREKFLNINRVTTYIANPDLEDLIQTYFSARK